MSSKVYFVLYNSAACELARHEADSSYPNAEAADYRGQMTRWMAEEHIELQPGDSIHIEEAP
jgi:quercetin dioxygenase-like cupin family protein